MLKPVLNRTSIAIGAVPCSLATPDFTALFPSVGTFGQSGLSARPAFIRDVGNN